MANGTDWEGQKRINGELCRVDWRLISALREVSEALAQVSAARSADGAQLVPLNLTVLNAMIAEADGISEVVADIIPPGCDPRNQKD